MIDLAKRYEQVLARIASACSHSQRDLSEVELVVVSKNHPAELVAELYRLGQRHFGENRDQEASGKAVRLIELEPEAKAVWHFVGQLQTNKVKSVLTYARVIHSIDRLSLVKELAKQLPKHEGEYSGFIELNLTEDDNRGGVLPKDLLSLASQVQELPQFRLRGLMAVAGLDKNPAAEFERVLQFRETLISEFPHATELSMGMSEDFETAIAMGATHIRVGSAITGPRPQNA